VEDIWMPDERLERRGHKYVMERVRNEEIRSCERQASGKNFNLLLLKLPKLVRKLPGHKFYIYFCPQLNICLKC
jgi:hypothetical protein